MFHYTHHSLFYCITRPSINVTSVVIFFYPSLPPSVQVHAVYTRPYYPYIVLTLCMANIPITYYWQLFHSTSFHYIIIALLSLLLLLSFVPSVHLWPKITHDCLSRSEEPSFAYRHYSHLINTITYSVLRQQAVPPPINIYLASTAAAVASSVPWVRSNDMGFFHGISSMLWVIWGCYSAPLLKLVHLCYSRSGRLSPCHHAVAYYIK